MTNKKMYLCANCVEDVEKIFYVEEYGKCFKICEECKKEYDKNNRFKLSPKKEKTFDRYGYGNYDLNSPTTHEDFDINEMRGYYASCIAASPGNKNIRNYDLVDLLYMRIVPKSINHLFDYREQIA
jgi:hypothetical protein